MNIIQPPAELFHTTPIRSFNTQTITHKLQQGSSLKFEEDDTTYCMYVVPKGSRVILEDKRCTEQDPMATHVMISLTSQSRLGYAKYRIRKDGTANKMVIRMYKAKMAALAGIAYKTIRRNMKTKGNLAVK